jgi:hypothetical protein
VAIVLFGQQYEEVEDLRENGQKEHKIASKRARFACGVVLAGLSLIDTDFA